MNMSGVALILMLVMFVVTVSRIMENTQAVCVTTNIHNVLDIMQMNVQWSTLYELLCCFLNSNKHCYSM